MPHVVVNGDLMVEDAFGLLKPVFLKEEGLILKTSAKYMDEVKRNIIIESLSIEGGSKRDFLVLVSQRDDGVVVRLHTILEVEKTDGVKRLLAEVAKQIIASTPGTKVGKTNLTEFL